MKHVTSNYAICSWCPNDVNCNYHNAYFTFFRGFIFECPFGEYSANGDLDCHRKNVDKDEYCQEGYYRATATIPVDDQWLDSRWTHDQDRSYECVPINKSPSAGFETTDSTKTPNCGVGDWLRYGIQGCAVNAPGFYNDGTEYTDTQTACAAGFICHPDRINGELKTSQFSCPKGSKGLVSGATSELEQCDLCPEGSYCPEDTSTEVTCPQGYFCPPGTADELQFT